MKIAIALVTASLGCRGHHESPPAPVPSPVPSPSTLAPTSALDAAPPPVTYRPGDLTIVTPAVTQATLMWDAPVLTPAELERATADLEALRARGRLIVSFPDRDTLLDQYDARTRRGTYRGHGLEGLDTGPIVAFTETPDITRGEMPLGGHARLHTGYLAGTIAADEPTWRAFVDSTRADPLTMQLLIEVRARDTVEGVPVIFAKLHGVRVVRPAAHEVHLEGTPNLARPVR